MPADVRARRGGAGDGVKIMTRRPYDPLLKHQPWRIFAVFHPLESVLDRLEREGTVDAVGRQIVFREESRGELYDLPAALRGVIEFHQLAEVKYSIDGETGAMEKFANKLEYGMPVFESDIAAVRENIATCKRQAMALRVSQATALIDAVRIGAEVDRLGLRAA